MSVLTSALQAFTSIESVGPLTGQRILDFMGGPPAASGATVNHSTVLGLPAAFACVRVISEGVASLPLQLMERMEPRGRRTATEHPLYWLLHAAPNPFMTSFKLRETLQGHLCFRGNAFCEIELDRRGRPAGLWPLRPDAMDRPVLSGSNELLYTYTLPDGTKKDLPQQRVLHLRGLSDDGLWGYAPISVFREQFGHALAVREYSSRFFGNNARPGGVLQLKNKVSPEAADRMRASWQSGHGGLSMAHRVAVLEEGVEWKSIGMSNEDAQFVETAQLGLGDFARMFNIKPHKIADLLRSTFSNIESQSIEHVTDTLMPWLVNWEQQMDKDLLLPSERQRFYTKHNVSGLLRGDATTRAAFYTAMAGVGAFSPDDIREREDENPLPDGVGNVYFRPANWLELGAEPAAPEPVGVGTGGEGVG